MVIILCYPWNPRFKSLHILSEHLSYLHLRIWISWPGPCGRGWNRWILCTHCHSGPSWFESCVQSQPEALPAGVGQGPAIQLVTVHLKLHPATVMGFNSTMYSVSGGFKFTRSCLRHSVHNRYRKFSKFTTKLPSVQLCFRIWNPHGSGLVPTL